MAIKLEVVGYLRNAYTEYNEKLKKELLFINVEQLAPTDEDGEKIGKDTTYQVSCFDTEKFPISSLRPFKDKKVVISCFLNSNGWYNQKKGRTEYIMGLNMKNIKSWQQAQNEEVQKQERLKYQKEKEGDLLPGEYKDDLTASEMFEVENIVKGKAAKNATLPSNVDLDDDDLPF